MDWKDKLGLREEEKDEVFELEETYIFSKKVDDYFLELGFYYDTMHPRFMDSPRYKNLKLDEPVLRYDGDWCYNNEGVQRVFMNQHEIYIERQTNYRSYDGCSYHSFRTPPETIREMEEILDKLIQVHYSVGD